MLGSVVQLCEAAFAQTTLSAARLVHIPTLIYKGRRCIHILHFWAQQTPHPQNSVTLETISSMTEWVVWNILCGWGMSSQWCQVANERLWKDCRATSRVLVKISCQNFLAFERLQYLVTDGLIGCYANRTHSHSQAIKYYCLSKPFASRCCLDQTNLRALWEYLDFKDLVSDCQTQQLCFGFCLHSHLWC